MSINIGRGAGSHHYRLPPKNKGIAKVASDRINEVVDRANAQYNNALSVDGTKVILWLRRERAGVPCTCQTTDAHEHLHLDGNIEEKTYQDGEAANSELPLPSSNTVTNKTRVRRVRGGKKTAIQGDSLEDAINKSLDFVPNQPSSQVMSLSEVEISQTEIDSILSQAEMFEPDEELAIQDFVFGMTAGDKSRCGICFGSGFVDGYTFYSGQRIILAAHENNFRLNGGAYLNREEHPYLFELGNTSDCYVEWTQELPTYFSEVRGIHIRNNTRLAANVALQAHFGDNNWLPLTNTLLESRNGIPTTITLRAVPANSDEFVGDSKSKFTHVEFTYVFSEYPYGQLAPIVYTINMEHSATLVQTNIELSPDFINLTRESVFEDSKHGYLWKITELTPKRSVNNKVYAYDAGIRLIQPVEMFHALKETYSIPEQRGFIYGNNVSAEHNYIEEHYSKTYYIASKMANVEGNYEKSVGVLIAGQEFNFSGPVQLTNNNNGWAANATVRDPETLAVVDTLTTSLTYVPQNNTQPLQYLYNLTLFKDAASTASWPSPTAEGTFKRLVIDVEFSDGINTISSSNFYVFTKYNNLSTLNLDNEYEMNLGVVKAGDTFNFAGQLELAAPTTGSTWTAACTLRDAATATIIDTITTTLTAIPVVTTYGDSNYQPIENLYAIELFKDAAATNLWPRPTKVGEYTKLVADIQFTDGTQTISSDNFYIYIEYDPTQ